MKKLILCVDRDDDVGEKTGLDTPLIGREDNLNAAVELGLKDPEDSDTNSIFSAISTYDKLKREGDDVEIATVCGSSNVGYRSDQILSKELDSVLKAILPDTVILITDGAEDEYITPIISSKVDISHVKTVYVKQSQSVENLYYMIVKSLQEEKAKKKLLLPVSLALLVYGIFGIIDIISAFSIHGWEAFTDISRFGTGFISLVLGTYILGRIYDIGEKLFRMYRNLKKAVSTSAVWLPFTAVAILVVLSSALAGWNAMMDMEDTEASFMIMEFSTTVIWWWIGAVLLHELGQVLHLYLTQGKIKRSFWAVLFSTIAMTLIFWGIFEYLRGVLGMEEMRNVLPMVAVIITLGLSIGVLGAVTQIGVNEEEEKEEKKEVEEGD